MLDPITQKWLSPIHLRNLLLDLENSKNACIQIARFCAAYYLDFLLFLPPEGHVFPSLYIWGSYEDENDLPNGSTLLNRTEISQKFPVEYSPALPAILLVKCDHLIESISYTDHFDDKRTALILRLLADSIHQKDLTSDYIKTTIFEQIPVEIEETKNFPKFADQICQSILELDVSLQKDFLPYLEETLCYQAEYYFSQLPLEATSLEVVRKNPIFEAPGGETDRNDEGQLYLKIHRNLKIVLTSISKSNRTSEQLSYFGKICAINKSLPSQNSKLVLHRVLLLALRLEYRRKFAEALKCGRDLAKIAENYKFLLNDEFGDVSLLRKWVERSSQEEVVEEIEKFSEWIQNEYKNASSLPPLCPINREVWLRRIVLNNSADHRDVRQERVIDWFRSICNPKHRVCDITISQMLLINSQWTSPGFSHIPKDCHALRLSIHPHDLCLGTNTYTANYSLSARDILYDDEDHQNEMDTGIWTQRDVISYYAQKFQHIQSSRPFKAVDEKIKRFSKEQCDIQRELEKERQFLESRTSNYSSSSFTSFTKPRKFENDGISKQIEILSQKLEHVVQRLEHPRRSSYIKEDDEESIVSELPFDFENAPIAQKSPTIEKLDFGSLSGRSNEIVMQTAVSIENPTFNQDIPTPKANTLHHQIPPNWMKLLPPMEQSSSARFTENLLIFDGKPPVPKNSSFRKVVSERGTQTSGAEKIKELLKIEDYNNQNLESEPKKIIDDKMVKRMSREEIRMVLDRIH